VAIYGRSVPFCPDTVARKEAPSTPVARKPPPPPSPRPPPPPTPHHRAPRTVFRWRPSRAARSRPPSRCSHVASCTRRVRSCASSTLSCSSRPTATSSLRRRGCPISPSTSQARGIVTRHCVGTYAAALAPRPRRDRCCLPSRAHARARVRVSSCSCSCRYDACMLCAYFLFRARVRGTYRGRPDRTDRACFGTRGVPRDRTRCMGAPQAPNARVPLRYVGMEVRHVWPQLVLRYVPYLS